MVKQNYQALETTNRFLKDAIKGAGFTFNQCIAEFIDNSLDARAENIRITFTEVFEKIYNIDIVDDGKGIRHDKIYDVLKKIGYGKLEDYSSNSISNFGLGMKFAMVNLCSGGDIEVVSVCKGKKSKLYLNVDNIPCISEPTVVDSLEKSYTSISIPNVKITSNQITLLAKFLGVTYFPHIDNDNKLSIIINHRQKDINVEFSDPFYRNVEVGVNKNDDDCEIDGYKIFIRGRYYDSNFSETNLSYWDTKGGGASFAASRSGIYFRLNGRYITLGEGDFLKPSDQQSRNRLRIEVELDRELIGAMGIGFNKSKITIDKNNDKLKEFISKIDNIVTFGVNLYTKSKQGTTNLSLEEQEEREALNKDLTAKRRKYPLDISVLPETPLEKIIKKDPKDPNQDVTKNRPAEIGPYNKDGILIDYISQGPTSYCFDFNRVNKKLVISYNTDHNFYNYYKTLDMSAKKLFDSFFLAFADSMILTKTEHSDEDFSLWKDDLMRNFSGRLGKYNKD